MRNKWTGVVIVLVVGVLYFSNAWSLQKGHNIVDSAGNIQLEPLLDTFREQISVIQTLSIDYKEHEVLRVLPLDGKKKAEESQQNSSYLYRADGKKRFERKTNESPAENNLVQMTRVTADGKTMTLKESSKGYPELILDPYAEPDTNDAVPFNTPGYFLPFFFILHGDTLQYNTVGLEAAMKTDSQGEEYIELHWTSEGGNTRSYTLHVSPKYGYAVTYYAYSPLEKDSYEDSAEYKISEYVDVGGGLYLPRVVSMKVRVNGTENDIHEREVQVTASQISVNEPLSDDIFHIEYTRGMTIRDRISNLLYTVGAEDKSLKIPASTLNDKQLEASMEIAKSQENQFNQVVTSAKAKETTKLVTTFPIPLWIVGSVLFGGALSGGLGIFFVKYNKGKKRD